VSGPFGNKAKGSGQTLTEHGGGRGVQEESVGANHIKSFEIKNARLRNVRSRGTKPPAMQVRRSMSRMEKTD